MSELKMADVWGWDAIPQDYGHYESFTLNGVERKGDFYGLLFCTEEAANAVSHAVKNHDRLEQENAELREAATRFLDSFEGVERVTYISHQGRAEFLKSRKMLRELLNK